MGRNGHWIKNIGENYSIKNIKKYFSNLKVAPATKQEYERQRYFDNEKIKKYNKKESIHDNAVEKIFENPSIIGINDEFYNAETEVNFFHKNLKKGSVDVLIETKNDVYGIEYKCNHTSSNRKHAKVQLKRAKEYIKKNFGTDLTKLLYVSGDFNVEILDKIIPYK